MEGFDLRKIQDALAMGETCRAALQHIEHNVIGMGGAYDRLVNRWNTNVPLKTEDINTLFGIIKEIQGVCIRELSATARKRR